MRKKAVLLAASGILLSIFFNCQRNKALSVSPPLTPDKKDIFRVTGDIRTNNAPDLFSIYSDTYTTGVYAQNNYKLTAGGWTENEWGDPHPSAATVNQTASAAAPEGNTFYTFTDGPQSWFGASIWCEPQSYTIDATGYSNICFSVRHKNAGASKKLTFIDGSDTTQEIPFPDGEDQWHDVSVAATIDVSDIKVINVEGVENADIEICIDNIRLEK